MELLQRPEAAKETKSPSNNKTDLIFAFVIIMHIRGSLTVLIYLNISYMYHPLFIRFNFSDPTLVRMPTTYVKVKDNSSHVPQKYFNKSI